MSPRILIPLFAFLCAAVRIPAADAPYVDAKAVRERFDSITTADMETLRGKKIIFATRSFGLNTWRGLEQLARKDGKYELLSSSERFDIRRGGGDVNIVPADIFSRKNFVHLLISHWPLHLRLEEMESLLAKPPHSFGEQVDIVVIYYEIASPSVFETYVQTMSDWQKRYPRARFIHVTGGVQGPKQARANTDAHAFGRLVRERLKGKVPLYDMEAILSGDWRDGPLVLPEYSTDPAEVHPNTPEGEQALAKGFLLILKEALAHTPAASGASSPPTSAPAATARETLPPEHPEIRAVRAILDANGLRSQSAADSVRVENGRVVALYLQEAGIARIPDEIGVLTALRTLHVYGDRKLDHPLLREISPAIGRCAGLEELLLNDNDLATLPADIAKLRKVRLLALGDNRLRDLPAEVVDWARPLDPAGLANQRR